MIRLQRVAERASTARSGQDPPQTPQAKHPNHSQTDNAQYLRAAEERTRTIHGNTRKNRERQSRNGVNKANCQVAGSCGHPLRLQYGLRGNWLRRIRVRGCGRNLLTVLCLLFIRGTMLTIGLLILPVLPIGALLGVLPVLAIGRITILVRSRHRFLPLAALRHRTRRPHPHHHPAEYDNNAEPTGQQSARQHCPHN